MTAFVLYLLQHFVRGLSFDLCLLNKECQFNVETKPFMQSCCEFWQVEKVQVTAKRSKYQGGLWKRVFSFSLEAPTHFFRKRFGFLVLR